MAEWPCCYDPLRVSLCPTIFFFNFISFECIQVNSSLTVSFSAQLLYLGNFNGHPGKLAARVGHLGLAHYNSMPWKHIQKSTCLCAARNSSKLPLIEYQFLYQQITLAHSAALEYYTKCPQGMYVTCLCSAHQQA